VPTHSLGNVFFSVSGFFNDELNSTLANMLSEQLAKSLLLALLEGLKAPIRAAAHDPSWLDLMVYSNYQDTHKVISTSLRAIVRLPSPRMELAAPLRNRG
jgi:hypothetical protein